ncbi:uncharacterized protein KGF55_004624 [Candida pseudojiufengensis]|uniref:uncharacterized protein n=1 Tax=Candida pseudojiufengensis TaxID=497109 RepID=UPI0022253A2F|nr:uncharacterized protein KGF55_004624 [Candida pseudojiufengensis]KAI5960332.1 hypothetical protein KGF55_004624 [Candida pseudojiufengensis]
MSNQNDLSTTPKSSSYLSFFPDDYLYYLEFLPNLQNTINLFMTFTPLFSYGTTCISIYKRKTSLGFSIDICGTMFMASILRIYYYICSPYEITLLRQSIIMILIQTVLLKISLAYRPSDYDPELLSSLPNLKHEIEMNLPRRLSFSSINFEHKNYSSMDTLEFVILKFKDLYTLAWCYFKTFFKQTLRLFDVYYKRPGLFWQWSNESSYWIFLSGFALVFGILTGFFKNNENFANFIGILGLFIESLLPLPQILMLNRIQSVKNFKIILLLSWLGGDCTKISYLIYGTNQISIIFIAAGLFQMCLDLFIAYQYISLKYLKSLGGSKLNSQHSVDEIVHNILSDTREEDLEMNILTSSSNASSR